MPHSSSRRDASHHALGHASLQCTRHISRRYRYRNCAKPLDEFRLFAGQDANFLIFEIFDRGEYIYSEDLIRWKIDKANKFHSLLMELLLNVWIEQGFDAVDIAAIDHPRHVQ